MIYSFLFYLASQLSFCASALVSNFSCNDSPFLTASISRASCYEKTKLNLTFRTQKPFYLLQLNGGSIQPSFHLSYSRSPFVSCDYINKRMSFFQTNKISSIILLHILIKPINSCIMFLQMFLVLFSLVLQ